MGQPAFTNAFVRFDTDEHASAAVMEFHKWIKLALNGELPQPEGKESVNGDYGISAVDREGTEITYQVESGRYQNCIWQCQNIRRFWLTQPGLEQLEQSIMTVEDSVDWYKGDEIEDEPRCPYCESGIIQNGECAKCGL